MLSDRLREIIAKMGISLSEYADMCGLPLETVRNIYYGKTSDPKISTVLQMASALDMSVNDFVGQQSESIDERAVMKYYRMCGNHGKSIIQLVAKYEAVTAKSERDAIGKHKIPCMIANGNINNGIDYASCETFDIETVNNDAYVAIKLTTNDAVPNYCKGDIILIANRFPASGEFAVFYTGSKAYIKLFLERDGSYLLRSIHNSQDDIILKRMDQIEYIGTCIGVVRAL